MYKVILCNTLTEASAYARDQGFSKGSYRYAARASTIRGLRVAEVHQLPSYAKRFDRHAINQTLRFARNLQHFLIDPESWSWPRRPVIEDQGDGMGPQVDIFEAIAEAQAQMIAEGSPVTFKEVIEASDAISASDADALLDGPQLFTEDGQEEPVPTLEGPIVQAAPKPKPRAPKPRKPRVQKPKTEAPDSIKNFFVDLEFAE